MEAEDTLVLTDFLDDKEIHQNWHRVRIANFEYTHFQFIEEKTRMNQLNSVAIYNKLIIIILHKAISIYSTCIMNGDFGIEMRDQVQIYPVHRG